MPTLGTGSLNFLQPPNCIFWRISRWNFLLLSMRWLRSLVDQFWILTYHRYQPLEAIWSDNGKADPCWMIFDWSDLDWCFTTLSRLSKTYSYRKQLRFMDTANIWALSQAKDHMCMNRHSNLTEWQTLDLCHNFLALRSSTPNYFLSVSKNDSPCLCSLLYTRYYRL